MQGRRDRHPVAVNPATTPPRFHLNPMLPRDPAQPHRAASTLELFFDLVFVVAVGITSAQLHRALSHGDVAHGLTSYAMLFFFALIVLGERLLASSNAIVNALGKVESLGPLIAIAALTLVVTASLWWVYFWPPHHRSITTMWRSLRYGYTHYFVFAAAAAFSVGIEVELYVLTGESHLSSVAASFTVTVPVAIFLLGIWWIAIRDNADRVVNIVVPVGAVLVLLDPVLPIPVTLTAVVMVIVVAVLVVRPPVTRAEPLLAEA